MPRSPELSAAPGAAELSTAPATLHVMVGIISDTQGRLLINQRRPGTHMAGHWEFPGGKRAADESRLEALSRELAEELGIRVVEAEPLTELIHDYPDRRVLLDVWRVLSFEGEPQSLEDQPLRWVATDALAEAGLLPADRPIVDVLRARHSAR